jgi:hypothetical protein
VARFELGEIEIKMGRGKVHTEVRLFGDLRQWAAARPVIKLDIGGESIRQGNIVGQSLSADWDLLKDKKGNPITGRWGGTLKFSTELSHPEKVATPPPPVTREIEVVPSLDEFTRELGPKELRFVGKARFMPTNAALRIVCERVDELGQWQEDAKVSGSIRYKISARSDSHFGYCSEVGVFEASIPKSALKKVPGTFRFTWLPVGPLEGAGVAISGIAVAGKSVPEVKPEDVGL